MAIPEKRVPVMELEKPKEVNRGLARSQSASTSLLDSQFLVSLPFKVPTKDGWAHRAADRHKILLAKRVKAKVVEEKPPKHAFPAAFAALELTQGPNKSIRTRKLSEGSSPEGQGLVGPGSSLAEGEKAVYSQELAPTVPAV